MTEKKNIKPEVSTENEYHKQAREFLELTSTEFKAEFLKHDKYFLDDKESRDIYQITLTRGQRVYSFTFGQSIQASGQYIIFNPDGDGKHHKFTGTKKELWKKYKVSNQGDYDKNKNFSEPTPYDVLACLTKYDPEDFNNFCSEFGYDNDSRKAEKIYNAVVDEYKNLLILFSDEEMDQIREIN